MKVILNGVGTGITVTFSIITKNRIISDEEFNEKNLKITAIKGDQTIQFVQDN
ncbi:hypothetical protein J2T56_002362 [Natronobacillus azotifigens]|uniref:Uncharacterized protein n=1 Tax=Natronobacillus azotifigens TaxID=472978 RepID=A0A9J6RFE5_9BACI|nr:hypothetical protein [Natronobacillus azotifigens]MCZ0704116.1 hypothetical protein [Natronobacillus azotifigens]